MFKFLVVTTLYVTVVLGIDEEPKILTNHHSLFPIASGNLINGRNIDIENAPWQVGLYHVSVNETGYYATFECGGSIISSEWVLTSAHCLFESDKTKNMVNAVIAGSSLKFNGTSSVHKIEQKICHHGYIFVGATHTILNDIALARVERSFDFGPTRQPIELYNRDPETLDNSIGFVTGWGTTRQDGNGGYPENLKTIRMKILPKDTCEWLLMIFYNRPRILRGHICAYNERREVDVCKGDSGGPLTVNGTLVGIVAWGPRPCAKIGVPAVFIEVANYLRWIWNYVPGISKNETVF